MAHVLSALFWLLQYVASHVSSLLFGLFGFGSGAGLRTADSLVKVWRPVDFLRAVSFHAFCCLQSTCLRMSEAWN